FDLVLYAAGHHRDIRSSPTRRSSDRYPEAVVSAIPLAATARHSAQQIAFNEVGRQVSMSDPDWNGGNYYGGKLPARGLAVARMRSEEHTSELQSRENLVCHLLLEKKK